MAVSSDAWPLALGLAGNRSGRALASLVAVLFVVSRPVSGHRAELSTPEPPMDSKVDVGSCGCWLVGGKLAVRRLSAISLRGVQLIIGSLAHAVC